MKQTDDTLLPLWYEEKGAECDYTLFPIRQQDADMLLFNAVWDVVKHPLLSSFVFDTKPIGHSAVFRLNNGSIVWERPYLIFPADHPGIWFTDDELAQPFIIAAFSTEEVALGESGLVEEDDYPVFRLYYTAEWDLTFSPPEVVYRGHAHGSEEDILPKMPESTAAFTNAVKSLLNFLDTLTVDVTSWKERLHTTLRMLDAKANELHILHQAGLYDIDQLWNKLYKAGTDREKLLKVSRWMNQQLHRYAMMAIHLEKWEK